MYLYLFFWNILLHTTSSLCQVNISDLVELPPFINLSEIQETFAKHRKTENYSLLDQTVLYLFQLLYHVIFWLEDL